MNDSDIERLRHMLDAAQAAQKSVQNETRASFETNEILGLALQKLIEIIGEAAAKVTQETRDQYPQLSRREMIAMRNVLIHGYFDINLEQVWKTVTEDIPPLIAESEKIIPSESPS